VLGTTVLQTNILYLTAFAPLLSSHVDNVLVRIASELNQFTNAVDVCIVNMLLHGRMGLIVNWNEVWVVRRP